MTNQSESRNTKKMKLEKVARKPTEQCKTLTTNEIPTWMEILQKPCSGVTHVSVTKKLLQTQSYYAY